ncbi:chemotaxis protein CheB [Methanoplanus endosymbiosus]|uniref:protein-glutamate O-methyltransferase n=1 Tax=Methanoplanus endosymbiosus TaxID=33865 RepID=A0A9E7TKN4_9EURY|nr:chemotaxis protein CheB [Methanoplanus endosymbiosus]UUX92909.1 PAS domain-containing protein [Methanoplanus endosymbiosus]
MADKSKSEETQEVTENNYQNSGSRHFPIVGIGASAGGLEALEQFLANVPPDSGMAFVIVQHLDPTHKGVMPELLRRVTTMKVLQVADNMKVLPDHVYIIPPNRDMSLLHGTLFLMEPAEPRGLRLPIDYFFRSLAEDQQDRSIGVILSGMGTDGTIGLRAIKEKAGIAFVQEPVSAKFDGMPRSAINAGLADIVAAAEELPEKIITYLHHAPKVHMQKPIIEVKSISSLAKIFVLLREHTGHDFSFYKKSSVYRRIERRMAIHRIDSINTYMRYLRENPAELDLLFHELLIGVTGFFRDPLAWEYIIDHVIPMLIKEKPTESTFRAWVAGCSTGEEAYSLAIAFREAMDKLNHNRNYTLQIFATDLDRDAIEKARQGLFLSNISGDVSSERLNRFFSREKGGYRIKKEIRETIIFASQNLIMDPPFTNLDILSCRNLLIYLEPELQKKIIPLFFYSLKPGGILFLGSSETIGGHSAIFSTIDNKFRLYKRKETYLLPEMIEFPINIFPRPLYSVEQNVPVIKKEVNLQALAEELILRQYSPPAVLTTDKGDILYLNGSTGKFIEPPAGKANWNIFVMAREGLRYELTRLFQKAVREKDTMTAGNLQVKTDAGVHPTDCTVQYIKEPKALEGMLLIVFPEAKAPPEIDMPVISGSEYGSDTGRIAELERELQRNYEELQTTREEMQTSQEELKSANEEMQSTNEELQSTNEELTTSREEMQSMNEELQTVNAELQGRVEEFSRTNNDMKNLLNSTEIATVFVDENMSIRRFTIPATRIINLIPGDEGRPVTDIASDLIYPDLVTDATEVLETLVFSEKEIQTRNNKWFRVRIMPYRTLENIIDGLVITFIDITSVKNKEIELIAARKLAEGIIATIREPLLVLDSSMKIVRANRFFYQMFHVSNEETEGKSLYSVGKGQWNIPELRRFLEKVLPEKRSFDDYIVRNTFPEIGERVMKLNARQIFSEDLSPELILLAIEDVTNNRDEAGNES